MEAESFFARWEKQNAQAAAERRNTQAPSPAVAQPLPAPTMEEVALLTPDADFSRFVAPGVDESVRRSALKKLFADPRFNVMDGLDVYIEDYHHFTPIPAAVLAGLDHARTLLDPLARLAPPEEPSSEEASGENVEDPDQSASEETQTDGDPVQGM